MARLEKLYPETEYVNVTHLEQFWLAGKKCLTENAVSFRFIKGATFSCAAGEFDDNKLDVMEIMK